MNFIRLAWR